MKKKKARGIKLTGLEKFYIFVILLSVISLIGTHILFNAQISTIKMNIEKVDYKIENQKKKIESLTMQVNELTSYDNVSSVIENMGLAYNNENIIIISK